MVVNNQNLNVIKCGGIKIVGSEFSLAPRRQLIHADPVLETQIFVNYKNTGMSSYDFETSLRIILQIIVQNSPGSIKRVKICEVISKFGEKLTTDVREILTKEPMLEVEYFSLPPEKLENEFDVLLITEAVVTNFYGQSFFPHLSQEGFVIYVGDFGYIQKYNHEIIFESVSDYNKIYLLRKKQNVFSTKYAVVNVSNLEYNWLEEIKILAENCDCKVVFLVSRSDENSGLVGLTKCLLTEPSNTSFRCVILDHGTDFSIDNNFYHVQLSKNLIFNVLRKNEWGTFVHLPLGDVEKRQVSNASVSLPTLGDLSTITWIERPSRPFK